MTQVYLRGMVISFALVSSIGMQNLFVFNSAMSNKLRRAFLITLFVWIADTTLTAVAFLGLGTLIAANEVVKLIVMTLGGFVVIYMGWGILRSANSSTFGNDHQEMTIKEGFIGAWVVAFANPQALVDTSVTLGALRSTLSSAQAIPFLLGIITATAIWFYGTTLIIGLLKNRLPKKALVWINIFSGVVVMGFGAMLLVRVVLALVK